MAGIVSLFFIPLDKKFSYHFVRGECDNKASWIYHRIYEDTRGIDIVFSGASHTGSAIMDELISEEMGKALNAEINAVNLGYCRAGRDIQFVMLQDLFSEKHPEILVIDVTEDEPKKSHPVFPYLAESADLFGSCVLLNQRYFSAILKGVVIRFEYFKSRIWQNSVSDTENISDKFGYRSSQHIVSEQDLEDNRKIWEIRLSKTKAPLLRKLELFYSKHYIEKIVRLANDNNCKVFFLYLPESGSNLKQTLLLDYYQKFGEVIILPDDIINNKLNWKDATHFNDEGASKTSEFLNSYLTNYLH